MYFPAAVVAFVAVRLSINSTYDSVLQWIHQAGEGTPPSPVEWMSQRCHPTVQVFLSNVSIKKSPEEAQEDNRAAKLLRTTA